MAWLLRFMAACVALVAAAAGVLWAAGGLDGLGLSGHGLAALIIGAVLTLLLTALLMGLVFYSNRSQHDQKVQDFDPHSGD